jgi:ribosomal protein L20
MPRVKRGMTSHRRHKKILKMAKGYRGSKSKLFRVANEQVMKSGNYAYIHRRLKRETSANYGSPGSMRRLVIMEPLTAKWFMA